MSNPKFITDDLLREEMDFLNKKSILKKPKILRSKDVELLRKTLNSIPQYKLSSKPEEHGGFLPAVLSLVGRAVAPIIIAKVAEPLLDSVVHKITGSGVELYKRDSGRILKLTPQDKKEFISRYLLHNANILHTKDIFEDL